MAGARVAAERGAKMTEIAAGQIVEICSAKHKWGGLYAVKNVNGADVYLAELDGLYARVLTEGYAGLWVDVQSKTDGRSGKVMVPLEVLKPLKSKKAEEK